MILTIIGGLAFLSCQAWEWTNDGIMCLSGLMDDETGMKKD